MNRLGATAVTPVSFLVRHYSRVPELCRNRRARAVYGVGEAAQTGQRLSAFITIWPGALAPSRDTQQ